MLCFTCKSLFTTRSGHENGSHMHVSCLCRMLKIFAVIFQGVYGFSFGLSGVAFSTGMLRFASLTLDMA